MEKRDAWQTARDYGTDWAPWITLLLGAAVLWSAFGWIAPAVSGSMQLSQWLAELLVSALLLGHAARAPRVPGPAVGWALLPIAALLCLYLGGGIEHPLGLGLVTMLVLAAGGLVGGHIGSVIDAPGYLLVIAYVAAIGDAFSVHHPSGLSAELLQQPLLLRLVSLSFPVLGTDVVAPLVGVGDVALTSALVVGTRNTGLSVRRTLVALGVAVALVILAVELAGRALPAAPLLAGCVVLAHPAARRLPARQSRRIALNLAAVTALLGGAWIFLG